MNSTDWPSNHSRDGGDVNYFEIYESTEKLRHLELLLITKKTSMNCESSVQVRCRNEDRQWCYSFKLCSVVEAKANYYSVFILSFFKWILRYHIYIFFPRSCESFLKFNNSSILSWNIPTRGINCCSPSLLKQLRGCWLPNSNEADVFFFVERKW